jgi:hypothetical protein
MGRAQLGEVAITEAAIQSEADIECTPSVLQHFP